MRNLPHKCNPKQELVIRAVFDFYGRDMPRAEVPRAKAVALWLMGRKKGIKLDERQEDAVWYVRQNLKDKTYVQSLLENIPISH